MGTISALFRQFLRYWLCQVGVWRRLQHAAGRLSLDSPLLANRTTNHAKLPFIGLFRHESRKAGEQLQRLENHVRRPVAVRGLRSLPAIAKA